MVEISKVKHDLQTVLADLSNAFAFTEQHLFVIGTSTSEVAGEHIGTRGSGEIAEALFSVFRSFSESTGVQLAFQCCEHLNRALVLERKTAYARGYEEVSVIPVSKAGGSMAAYAFKNLNDAVVVETIRADAGIDIGDTFIGMHLKHVAVPVRSKIKEIGAAHVTLAVTRPKLIGGARAVYIKNEEHENCT